jgi:hypothetical protein
MTSVHLFPLSIVNEVLARLDLIKDCEVRVGLKTDTWIKVLCLGKVHEQQVST